MKAPSICGILSILITLLSVVQSQQVCPSQCSCYPDPVTGNGIIDCSNRGLTSIPDLAYPGSFSLAKIDLSNNQLTTLDVEQIYKFIIGLQVAVLDFSSNSISDVIGTFDADLGFNYETLNLSSNMFTSFPENVIPVTHLRSRLILDFSNNRLTELTRHMFAGGNDLNLFGFQFLARNNMISQIHDETLQGVNIVDTVLDLRSNLLTTLSETFQNPRGVEEFRFSGNPWNCDCNLRWIIDPLRFIVNHTSNDPPNCVTPAPLQGRPIFGLKSSEFNCLPFQQGLLTRNIVNQDSFTLSCPASADPPNPEITWTVWLPCPSEGDPLELVFTSDEIALSNIDVNPRAAFRCTARNNAGSVNFDLDIRVNGEAGIDIPGTGVPDGGSESTMRPATGNSAGMMGSTMTGMVNAVGGGSTTIAGTDGNNGVTRQPQGRPVAGIIILVIILLVSWGVIGFLIYRIWQLKKIIGASEKKSRKVDEYSNGNTNNVAPTSVEYNNGKHHPGWGVSSTVHPAEPDRPVYAAPDKGRPVTPAKPYVPMKPPQGSKPPPPPKPTSNPYQYNTEAAEYDEPPLKFGIHNGGYDYNNRDSVI